MMAKGMVCQTTSFFVFLSFLFFLSIVSYFGFAKDRESSDEAERENVIQKPDIKSQNFFWNLGFLVFVVDRLLRFEFLGHP